MDTRIEAFKLYNDLAKQVLTLASALLLAIVGAAKGIGGTDVEIDCWLGSAIGCLLLSLLGGVILMGALTANIQGSKGIDASEITYSGWLQLGAFFAACVFLAVAVL